MTAMTDSTFAVANLDLRAPARARPNQQNFHFRRELPVHYHDIARLLHEERQREIENRIRFRAAAKESPCRESIRQRIGRRFIAIGTVLACDGPLQPAARN
jgi:hypothetical protein